ncbi:hypothetical protein M8494_36910 [Serratia ureilytica]
MVVMMPQAESCAASVRMMSVRTSVMMTSEEPVDGFSVTQYKLEQIELTLAGASLS